MTILKKYVRMLSYEEAEKLIAFTKGLSKETTYAHLTHGGVSIESNIDDWCNHIEPYIKKLSRYQITVIPPHEIERNIIRNLKKFDK